MIIPSHTAAQAMPWSLRSQEPCPATAAEALEHARGGFIAETSQVTAIQKGRFWEITGAVIGERPESAESLMELNEEDVPF